MDTERLIEALARETVAVSPYEVQRRLGASILTGALVALLLVVGGLGFRADLAAVSGGGLFWGKLAYPFALGLIGLMLTTQLARPDSQRLRRSWLVAVPIGLLLILATAELGRAAPEERASLVVDPSWACVPLILMLSVPPMAGLVWALRRMAPTRLRATGAAAGLAAGGLAATLYCLYCQQLSPTYVLTRYTVAIALASAAGALLGPRLLRW